MGTGKIAKPAKWPKLIYYKKVNGDIRKKGGRSTIAKINNDLNARQVEFELSQKHNQIYRYNDELTIEAFLRGGFWKEMIALDRVDAQN